MHASVLAWGRDRLRRIHHVATVLEVGSLDVNGSLRPDVMARWPDARYLGIDVHDGPGVDKVMDGLDAPMLGRFDLVVCTEVLEHAEHWAALVLCLKAVTRSDLLVTTRSPGYRRHADLYVGEDHWHAGDHWRFTQVQLTQAFAGWGWSVDVWPDPDPERPGVFAHATRIGRSPDARFEAGRLDP